MANKKYSDFTLGTPLTTDVLLVANATTGALKKITYGGVGTTAINIDVVKQYGVVADGVTDNVTALMQLRSDLSASNAYHYNLYFPSGTVLSSNNRWCFGIKSFTIIGGADRTTFRTIYSGTTETLQRPFLEGDPWTENVLSFTGGWTYYNAHLFNTANAGATTITLTTPANASNYTAGNRILIYGYDQIGEGWPPGTRYNEWNEITNVNVGTGVLTLKYSLKNSYDSTWWDNPGTAGGGSGKPRIILLDRVNYTYPKRMEYKNVVFGAPSGGASGASGTCQPVGENVYMENCVIEGHFWPSMARYTECKNIKCTGNPVDFSGEIDKVGGVLKITDSYFSLSISNATGFDQVDFDNCHFNESVWIAPKKVSYKNCAIRSNTAPSIFSSPLTGIPAGTPIDEFKIEGVTFLKGPSSSANKAVEVTPYQSMTIAAVSGNKILVPFGTLTDASALKVYTMSVGASMFKNDGTKSGLITNITFNPTYNSGQGAFEISGTWNVAPVAAETWVWTNIKDFIDLGGHKNPHKFRPFFDEYSAFRQGVKDKEIVKTAVFTLDSFKIDGGEFVCFLYGKIISIEAVVIKPYNGGDSQANLFIWDNSYADVLKLNTKTVGRRFMDEFAAVGTKSGDTQDITKLGIWHQNIRLAYRGSGGNLSDQTEEALPVIEIKVKYHN